MVGNSGNSNALLNIAGGSVNLYSSGNAWASYMQVGNGSSYRGFVNMTSGTLNPQRHLVLGNNGGFGAMTMSGGTLTVGSYFIMGLYQNSAGGTGVFNQTGGAVKQYQTSGNGATLIGSGNGSLGVMNLSGGSFDASAGGIFLPENGTSTGVLNISGTASVTAGNVGVQMGNSSSAVAGTLNLLGGTLTANTVQSGGGTSAVNFNGGTLKASVTNATFLQGLSYAYVLGNGGVIDNGSNTITVSQPLLTPAGSGIVGVSSISVANQGSGYLNAPMVTISGGTVSTAGATAIANMVDDGTGNGTYKVGSFAITSPGVYTVAPTTVALTGGGASTAASGFTISTSANTSGGMTFAGSGTTTLAGVNTYAGPTTVAAGTVQLSGGLALPAASAVTLASGAMLDLNGANSTIAGLNGSGMVDSSSASLPAMLTINSGNNASFGGVVQDSGLLLGLVKNGVGTQRLTGTNTYGGTTTVNAGELVISTASQTKGSYPVAGGATLGVTNSTGGSALVSNLTVAVGSTLEFQNVASATTPLVVASNVTVNGSCLVRITGTNGLVTGVSYPLVSYAGTFSGTFTNLQLQMPYGWRGMLVNVGKQIVLTNVAVVVTSQPQVNATANGSQLQLAWPADHTGWRLLMNTNLAGANWTDVSSNLVMTTNQINLPVVVTNGSVFYRLIYP